jgi:hypothetical protein
VHLASLGGSEEASQGADAAVVGLAPPQKPPEPSSYSQLPLLQPYLLVTCLGQPSRTFYCSILACTTNQGGQTVDMWVVNGWVNN